MRDLFMSSFSTVDYTTFYLRLIKFRPCGTCVIIPRIPYEFNNLTSPCPLQRRGNKVIRADIVCASLLLRLAVCKLGFSILLLFHEIGRDSSLRYAPFGMTVGRLREGKAEFCGVAAKLRFSSQKISPSCRTKFAKQTK